MWNPFKRTKTQPSTPIAVPEGIEQKPSPAKLCTNLKSWQTKLPYITTPNNTYTDIAANIVAIEVSYMQSGIVRVSTILEVDNKILVLKYFPISGDGVNTYQVNSNTVFALPHYVFVNAIMELLALDLQTLLDEAHATYPIPLVLEFNIPVRLSIKTNKANEYKLLDITNK